MHLLSQNSTSTDDSAPASLLSNCSKPHGLLLAKVNNFLSENSAAENETESAATRPIRIEDESALPSSPRLSKSSTMKRKRVASAAKTEEPLADILETPHKSK
jgi:hypothetical protein